MESSGKLGGKLIVFEGIDSSGKKTQTELLIKKLKREKKKVRTLHFPAYKTRFGRIIGEYLKGGFGKKEELSPEIGCLMYAIDRYQFKDILEKGLKHGIYFVLDRYTQSNIFQIAKGKKSERNALLEWLWNIESRLPKANAVVFLDVNPEIARKLLKKRKTKIKLKGKNRRDIHEEDIKFQGTVRGVYLDVAKKRKWIVVNCYKKDEMRTKEEIGNDVYKKLKNTKII